jgi:MFS family permease
MQIHNSNAAHNAASIHDPRHRRHILVAVCVALMAVTASVTGLNVALDLDASHSDVLWMINIYAITLAALLMPLGAVGDRWGRKPVLLAGLVIFGVANLAAGLDPCRLTLQSREQNLAASFLR